MRRLNINQKKQLEEAYVENYDNLLSAAKSILHDTDASEDIVHDAFIYAIKRIKDKDLPELTGDLNAYLFFAVKCRSLNKIKTKKTITFYFETEFFNQFESHSEEEKYNLYNELLYYSYCITNDMDKAKKILVKSIKTMFKNEIMEQNKISVLISKIKYYAKNK